MQILSLSCYVLLHSSGCIFCYLIGIQQITPPIGTIIKKKMRFLKIFPYFVIFYCFFTNPCTLWYIIIQYSRQRYCFFFKHTTFRLFFQQNSHSILSIHFFFVSLQKINQTERIKRWIQSKNNNQVHLLSFLQYEHL